MFFQKIESRPRVSVRSATRRGYKNLILSFSAPLTTSVEIRNLITAHNINDPTLGAQSVDVLEASVALREAEVDTDEIEQTRIHIA